MVDRMQSTAGGTSARTPAANATFSTMGFTRVLRASPPQAASRHNQHPTETVAGKRAERTSHRPPAADPYFRFGSVSRILSAIRILRGRLRCIAIPSQ